MKTNLLKFLAVVKVPEDWDHDKCKSLRALTSDDPERTYPPGPIDVAISEALAGLAAKLTAIDPEIELASEIQR